MIEKMNLFEARCGGYWNYRIPGILCTENGVTVVTTEARRGKGGDWAGSDALLRRSLDGGLSWEPPQLLVSSEQYGPGPLNNIVLISDRIDGTVHVLYCHNYARVFYTRSHDDCATFAEPLEITEALLGFRDSCPWRVIATGPGHGIQLRNGRLVVPVWMSDGSGTEFGAGKLGHRPSDVAVIFSDDGGETWECGDFVARNHGEVINPSETVAVELSDGRVLLNIRSESVANRRLVSISRDGAHGWSTPRFDQALLEPVCHASILRLRQTAKSGEGIILFANPDNLENELTPAGRVSHDRKRLSVTASEDDCRTWTASRVIESGPSGYSDLTELPDGTMLCAYECGMVTRATDNRFLTVARFDLAWVTSGAEPRRPADGIAKQTQRDRMGVAINGRRWGTPVVRTGRDRACAGHR